MRRPEAAAETVDVYVSESRYFGPHNPEAGHEAIVGVRWDDALRMLRGFNSSEGEGGMRERYHRSNITPAVLQVVPPPWLLGELAESMPPWLSSHMYREA